MSDLYHENLTLADHDTPSFEQVSKAFDDVAKWLHRKRSFKPEMLSEKEPLTLIKHTYNALKTPLDNLAVERDIPEELTRTLSENIFYFSGFKTYHQLQEASMLLKDEDGGFKPFDRFAQDVKPLNDRYNSNYLKAEYEFAVSSSQMAVRWKDYESDGDRYNLQYRTAADEKVRESHAALHDITLPPSDKFWDNYMPPNGWNCRCTVVQVRKGKYPESDSDMATEAGERATTHIGKDGSNKAKIFRFNPGKQQKIFPPKHPYLPKGCGDCKFKLAYNPNSEQCKACKIIGKCLDKIGTIDQIKQRRNEIKKEAKKFAETSFKNEDFAHEVFLSNRNIKELVNQPHKHYNEKNEAILSLDKLFQKSKYIGKVSKERPSDHFDSYIFETEIAGEKSWIIVRKYDRTPKHLLYSISDSDKISEYIKKETH